MKKKNGLFEYLEFLIGMSNSIAADYYKWILREGQFFSKDKILRDLPPLVMTKPKRKQCYYNSQLAAIENDDLEYYEGWAISDGIPIPLSHGFNVLDRKVVDYTWKNGIEYFGIRIPKNFYLREMIRTKTAGTILFQFWKEKIKKDEKGEKNE